MTAASERWEDSHRRAVYVCANHASVEDVDAAFRALGAIPAGYVAKVATLLAAEHERPRCQHPAHDETVEVNP